MTETERWYLECLRIKTQHFARAGREIDRADKRPPTIGELAAFCDRTHTPVWLAMRQLHAKGYVKQDDDRRYVETGAEA